MTPRRIETIGKVTAIAAAVGLLVAFTLSYLR
jgi:hypothetical protein